MTEAETDGTPDWVAIRRDYDAGGDTITDICERHGITRSTLQYRQRREHWPLRGSRHGTRQGTRIERLFAVLDKQLSKLADARLGDKEAQQLSELIKNFDKMTTMAESKDEAPPHQRDIKDIRDKLAKRIDQFKRR